MKKTLIIIGAAAVLVACSPTKKETPTQPVSIEQAINKQLTYGKAYDVDSNEYKTIAIGKQTWFAENLRTVKFNDGTAIANVTENAAWASNQEPAFAAFNNDVPVSAHGLLYNYKAIESGNLCPEGWRVSTDEDWNKLIDNLSGKDSIAIMQKTNNWNKKDSVDLVKRIEKRRDNIAIVLKAKGMFSLEDEKEKATNESGFSALPSGFRERDGRFHVMGENALWWSSSPRTATAENKKFIEKEKGKYDYYTFDEKEKMYTYYTIDMHNGMYYSMDKNTNVNHSHIARTVGLSVRCVKE